MFAPPWLSIAVTETLGRSSSEQPDDPRHGRAARMLPSHYRYRPAEVETVVYVRLQMCFIEACSPSDRQRDWDRVFASEAAPDDAITQVRETKDPSVDLSITPY